MQDKLDNIMLLSAGIANLPEEDKQYYDSEDIIQITLSGKSNALHEFHQEVYHACDCTFNRAEIYPELGDEQQQMTIYSLLEEKDTVQKHLQCNGVLNLHLWRL